MVSVRVVFDRSLPQQKSLSCVTASMESLFVVTFRLS